MSKSKAAVQAEQTLREMSDADLATIVVCALRSEGWELVADELVQRRDNIEGDDV